MFLTLCLVFLSWLIGTDELSRLHSLCIRPLILCPSSTPNVWRLREDMSVLRTWALWCVCVIGLLFLIDKVMRLLDWTLLCSFHSTEWGLLSARTVRYFFLSFEHSSALFLLRCIQGPSKVSDRRLFSFRDVSTLFEFLQGVIPVLRGSGVLQNLTPLIHLTYFMGQSLTISISRYLSCNGRGVCR